MTIAPTIILKPGRDKPARHRHPWIFSGAVDRSFDGTPELGQVVRVVSTKKEFVAWGFFNPQSQITVRLLDWQEDAVIDETWWRDKLEASIRRRDDLLAMANVTDSFRLVFAEADGLPGLIVDRYQNFLSIQILASGIQRVRDVVVRSLVELLAPQGILDHSDEDIRAMEGLPRSMGLLAGERPPGGGDLTIHENGHRFLVDLESGQKTGFYLDQRSNRQRVASYAPDRDTLDCFCYTGGFTVPVLAAGARQVTCVDSSVPALNLLDRNVALCYEDSPGTAASKTEPVAGNAFEVLRRFRDQNRHFDLIILDPPKLALSSAHVDKALRAYKDLNLLAMKLLTQDGILATFSCSGAVSRAAFRDAVAWAATDAGRSVQILEQLSQGKDHPVLVSFPESEYLKGLICRVL